MCLVGVYTGCIQEHKVGVSSGCVHWLCPGAQGRCVQEHKVGVSSGCVHWLCPIVVLDVFGWSAVRL